MPLLGVLFPFLFVCKYTEERERKKSEASNSSFPHDIIKKFSLPQMDYLESTGISIDFFLNSILLLLYDVFVLPCIFVKQRSLWKLPTFCFLPLYDQSNVVASLQSVHNFSRLLYVIEHLRCNGTYTSHWMVSLIPSSNLILKENTWDWSKHFFWKSDKTLLEVSNGDWRISCFESAPYV